jgi:hypothetical protein
MYAFPLSYPLRFFAFLAVEKNNRKERKETPSVLYIKRLSEAAHSF